MLARAALAQGDHDRVHRLLRSAGSRAFRADEALLIAHRACIIGSSYRARGYLAEAGREFRNAFDQLERVCGRRSIASEMVAPFVARSLYERNDLDAAAGMLRGRRSDGFQESCLQALPVSVRIAAQRGCIEEAASLIEHYERIAFERNWMRLQAACIVERARLGLPRIMDPDELVPPDEEEEAVADPLSIRARTFAILSEARIYQAIDDSDRPRLNAIADRLMRLAIRTADTDLRMKAALYSILPQLSGRCDRMVDLDTVKLLNQAAHNGVRRSIIDVLEVTGVATATNLGSTGYAPSSFLALLPLIDPSRIDIPGVTPEQHRSCDAFSFLTTREIEVLTALAAGVSNKEMARRLNLTPETVKWHLKNVMRKLDADSREIAVRHAVALGLSFSPDRIPDL
jgi:LuxR family maltose regulon positive regulatory protein